MGISCGTFGKLKGVMKRLENDLEKQKNAEKRKTDKKTKESK